MIVIAAGGDGVRIGGRKPERLLAGQRLIDHMIHWARPQTEHLALAVRPADGDWGTGLPLLYDRHQDIGPISALASAMHAAHNAQQPMVLLIGCDTPFLPKDLIPRLADALTDHGAALPCSHGRVHPMATLWRTDPARLDTWIAQGGQSMWRFAREIGAAKAAA